MHFINLEELCKTYHSKPCPQNETNLISISTNSYTVCKACVSLLTLISLSGRFPVLWTDNRETHLTLLINVRMIYFSEEHDFRRFERILGQKLYIYSKSTFIIRRIMLGRGEREREEH